ncbi:MAG TPA: hypothetical protein VN843_16395, partial [Anaerolineales bacterium]|nr:hypothetical protein [Anaerolineales bacterium]
LHGKRKAVSSHLENQRTMLRGDLTQEKESAQELHNTLELEIDLQINRGEAIPQPEFTGKELELLEANAKLLSDPTILQTVYEHLEKRYGTTAHGLEGIASRANETLKSTNEQLANVNEQIQGFTEDREFFPVQFKTTDGNEQIATLHDLTNPLGENVVSSIFRNVRSDRTILSEALEQHYTSLREERDSIQHFAKAVSELAETYREQLATLTPVRAQAPLNAHEFTVGESSALRLPFDSGGPRSPATVNFCSDVTTLNDPTESRGIKEHMADQLEQIRQAIDHVAAQNGASSETVIETGMVETESVASESLAILI